MIGSKEYKGLPGGSEVKNLCAMQEIWVQPLGQEYPLQKGMATHSSILGEFHGQRSLAGYLPWGLKESDMTEQLTHTWHTVDA